MNSLRLRSVSSVALVLALSGLGLGGCAGDETDASAGSAEDELRGRFPGRAQGNSAQQAAQAAIDISVDAPTQLPSLPGMTAAEQTQLLTVTVASLVRPGTQETHDLRRLLAVPRYAGSVARATITGAFRTGPLPAGTKIPFAVAGVPTEPVYVSGAVAAQVYECRVGATGAYAWTFVRPEAGLVPIGGRWGAAQPLSLDHFRFPGDAARSLPAGPAWRVASTALNQGVSTAGQALFIGAAEATIPNGTATGKASFNIPALRVRNVGSATITIPNRYFPVTDPQSAGTHAYVLRLNTAGGTAAGISPNASCAGPADAGRIGRSPYSTDYYFVEVRPELPPPAPEVPGFVDGLG